MKKNNEDFYNKLVSIFSRKEMTNIRDSVLVYQCPSGEKVEKRMIDIAYNILWYNSKYSENCNQERIFYIGKDMTKSEIVQYALNTYPNYDYVKWTKIDILERKPNYLERISDILEGSKYGNIKTVAVVIVNSSNELNDFEEVLTTLTAFSKKYSVPIYTSIQTESSRGNTFYIAKNMNNLILKTLL